MRDKSHMDAVERQAKFALNHPREKWKKPVNAIVNAAYDKANEFYERLEETEEGREIKKKLIEARKSE